MERKIQMLLQAFDSISFYVLGAGASADLTPMTFQIRDELIRTHWQLGRFSFLPIQQDNLTCRLVGDVSDDFILCRISPDFVKAHAYYQIARYRNQRVEYCPSYDVFQFAKSPSTIFTANLDGIVNRVGYLHNILPFHGEIPLWFGSNDYLGLVLDLFGSCDSMELKDQQVIFVEPEKFRITQRKEYRKAECYYGFCKFIVVIGYSFGQSNTGMDDEITFSYLFRTLYKKNKVPILVIAPDTYDLCYQIQDAIGSKEVYGISGYWDCLSKALIDCFIEPVRRSNTKKIIECYFKWEDMK